MLTSLAPMSGPAAPIPITRRGPGRSAVAERPEERRKHLLCATMALSGAFPRRKVEELFEISPRTVQLWIKKALGYDCREAEGLRRTYPGAR